MELDGSMAATNSMGEKLTSGLNNEGELYYGSGYKDNDENHMTSKEDNKGPDLESTEVEYTEVEVAAPDPYRGPVTRRNDTVYTEIRKSMNDLLGMAGPGECSIPIEFSLIHEGTRLPRHESWTRVGTLHGVGTVERIRLTSFLARSEEPVRWADHEMDKQQQAYAALQQRTSELSRERDQLRTNLSTLQRQVASLMADRDRERPSQAESPMADYATDDLTMASSPPARPMTNSTAHYPADSSTNRRPHRSFRVTFSGDPDDLAFFLIQAGSYMEVHGAGFRTDRE
uniref:Uncharacterized protein n=1 Tax=Sphaerodactylus townsendi TaxID=933632 RepID=A0ACB8EMH8_9SAUR